MPFEVVFWHWWSMGVVLLIVELLAPGTFFLWMGQSAGLVGIVLWLFPTLSLEHQALLFSLLSVVSITASRRFMKRHPIETDRPLLNQRTAQYIGRVFTLDAPILNGRGKIRVDDSTWRVEGDDCPAGARVRVVDAENVVLKVQPVAPQSAESPSRDA